MQTQEATLKGKEMREMEKKHGRMGRNLAGREEFGGGCNEKTPRRAADPAVPEHLTYDIDPAIPGYDTWDFERHREGQKRSRGTP